MLTQEQSIVQHALALFMKYGIKSITMDEIATQLGMSKKTIYQSFKDKDELVLKAFEQFTTAHKQECDHLFLQANNAIDAFLRFTKMGIVKMRQMHPGLLFDMQKYHRESWNKYLQFRNEYILSSVKQVILEGVNQQLFMAEIDVEICSHMHICHVDMALQNLYEHKLDRTLEQVFKETLIIFLRGIVTPTGSTILEEGLKNEFAKN